MILTKSVHRNGEREKRMADILVTGGAGFIGSELVFQLAAQDLKVVVVDNLVNGRRENLEGIVSDQIQFEIADIRDSERMMHLIKRVDIVFHLACLGVRHSIHSPGENHEVNATATLQLLSLAKDARVKRFVYVSSSEVYGTAQWVPMTEEHPTMPMTVYGASKLAGECYTRAFYRTYGFPTVVIRPFNTYGPRCHHEGDSGEVIPKFMLRSLNGLPPVVFGDGTQTRDFTYVSDIAKGILTAGLAGNMIGQTINLGSGKELTINDLTREVANVLGHGEIEVVFDAPRPADVLRLYADTRKARQLIGFEPSISLTEGLKKLKNWYLSLGKSPKMLLEQETIRNWEIK